MSTEWYVLDSSNHQQGPLGEAEIVTRIQSGELGPANLAWTQEFGADWKALIEIPAFAGLFPAAQPPEAAGSGVGDISSAAAAGLKKGWSALLSGMERGKQGAANTMARTKLNMKVSSLRKERERVCGALGQRLFEMRGEIAVPDALGDLVAQIEKLDLEIAETERQAAAVGQ